MIDYQTYKASREWALRRESVRKRANGKCERCRMADMQQVHHLTYARIGDEPLEDLLGVCKPCHEFLSAKADIDPVTDGVRVYLAGPITHSRWRDDLLVFCETESGTDKNGLTIGDYTYTWPFAPRGLRDGFDFTGPWYEDNSGGHGCVPDEPHGWIPNEQPKSSDYVSSACRGAIEASDVIFCWIPSGCSPWGTVWELGFATALGKIIVIYEQTGNNHDRWLAGASADVWSRAETPVLAWESFMATWKESVYLRERIIRNPRQGTE